MRRKDKLTPREKTAGALLLCGMVLLCCDNIAACAAGVALLWGAVWTLNRKEGKRVQLEAQAQKDKPKVLFADAVATAKTSILIGELAKILKQNGVDIGQNRMFEWMRRNGYLIQRKGTDYNMPTQRAMEAGLFEIKETSITHADGHVSVNKTPKVTGKGQQYFINRFLQ